MLGNGNVGSGKEIIAVGEKRTSGNNKAMRGRMCLSGHRGLYPLLSGSERCFAWLRIADSRHDGRHGSHGRRAVMYSSIGSQPLTPGMQDA